MTPFVICTECGIENEINSLFCNDCGAKLDLTKLQHGDVVKSGKRRDRGERGGGSTLLKVVRNLVILALLAGLGLMFWPPVLKGEVGEDQLGKDFHQTISDLQEACSNGDQVKMVLYERDINAYAADVIAGQVQGGRLVLSDVNISVDVDSVEVGATMKLGPVPLVYLVKGKPIVGGDQFEFEIQGVHIGHLPVFGPVAGFVSDQVTDIFEGMRSEQFILNHLAGMKTKIGALGIMTRAAN